MLLGPIFNALHLIMPLKCDGIYEESMCTVVLSEVICRFQNYWMFSTSDGKTIPSLFLA